MALAALIAAYHESDEPGGTLRATLGLAGRTLVERQAKLAAAAGASPVVLMVERLPTDLLEAIDRLRRDRLAIVVARNVREAAEAIDPDDRLLLIADGFIGDKALLDRLVANGKGALLTVPDGPFDDRFERIDSESRWGGLALLDGGLLQETAGMLEDWDLQSTLLRRAIQSGGRAMAWHRDDGEQPPAVVTRGADLSELQRRVFDSAGDSGGPWLSRRVLAPFERAATRMLMPGSVSPRMLGIAAVALTGLSALSFLRGALWFGMLAAVLATPLDGVAGRLARLRMEDDLDDAWWAHLLPALAGAGLLALGYSLVDVNGWSMVLLAVVAIAFLLALRIEIEGRSVSGAAFLAERKSMTWIMAAFALLGMWGAGLVALFAYAAGSFFWAQHQVHARDRAAPGLD